MIPRLPALAVPAVALAAALFATPAFATTFAFDALAATNAAVPFALTADGITARFSSPSGAGAFEAQDGSAFATLGTAVLANDNFAPEELDIAFSRALSSVAFAFATNDGSAPTTVTLTALLNGRQVGRVSATGAPAASGVPEGALSFGAALFDAVQVTDSDPTNVGFAIGPVAAQVPEPAPVLALGAGLLALLTLRHRRT